MSASAPWSKVSAARSWSGSTARLAADVYVSAANDAQAIEIKAWLRERPEVEAILPGGRADTQLAGAPIEVLGLARSRHLSGQLAAAASSAANAWSRLASRRYGPCQRATGPASEALCRRPHRGPAPGGSWPLEVVGIYADYGNPKGQIAVNYRRADAALSRNPLTRLGLRVAPAQIPALISALQEKFGLDERNVADQATMKAESTRIFNRTFAVTAALNAFTLGVAGIALLTSLLTLGQFAPAATGAAVGNRRHAAAAGRHRTLENDVGGADHHHCSRFRSGCWWRGACSRSSNVKAFGWRLPFHVFPMQLLWLVGVAMAAALAAAAAPGHQAGAHAAGEPDQDLCQ